MKQQKVIEQSLQDAIEAIKEEINKHEPPCQQAADRYAKVKVLQEEFMKLQKQNDELIQSRIAMVDRGICPKCAGDLEYKEEKKPQFHPTHHKRIEDKVVRTLNCTCGFEFLIPERIQQQPPQPLRKV